MPHVQSSLTLGALNRDAVWRTLCDFARYPEFMPDVLEVRVEQRSAQEAVSHWRVLLNGSEMAWTERNVMADGRISFEQIEGDLEVWRGEWLLTGADGHELRAELNVSFDIGIPALAEVLHPIGERAIRANSRQMLEGIRARVGALLPHAEAMT
jgi:ribosome-associated toxin RatA of RatAB toxin-antitoxin module